MTSFLLDVRERGKHVLLGSAIDLDVADRIKEALTRAGFQVILKHQPEATELKLTRGKSGAN